MMRTSSMSAIGTSRHLAAMQGLVGFRGKSPRWNSKLAGAPQACSRWKRFAVAFHETKGGGHGSGRT